jgi:WD repeat-containing protein 81
LSSQNQYGLSSYLQILIFLQLVAPESHLLVSSSLDKTLRIWDLRKSWTPQPFVVKGHNDGVSGFSIWGKDVISISRNNIGIFSLAKSQDEVVSHSFT